MGETARTAARRLGLECQIEKVNDPLKFIDCAITAIPTLVIDGKVIVSGPRKWKNSSPPDMKLALKRVRHALLTLMAGSLGTWGRTFSSTHEAVGGEALPADRIVVANPIRLRIQRGLSPSSSLSCR